MTQSGHLHWKLSGKVDRKIDQREKVASDAAKTFKRRFFLCSGFLSIGVGILGIVLPILDTTPFMLFGAYCFARSSPKWHRWLLRHPIFGEYIAAFREKRGLTMKQKRRIALITTAMLSLTAFLHGAIPVMKWIIGIIWIACMTFLYFSRTAITTPGSTSSPLEGRTR